MDAVRTTNRIVSALLALALTVGGVIVVVEVVLAALDRAHWVIPHEDWARSARETVYSDRSARVLFALLGFAGLALLLLELVRRRTPALPMTPGDESVVTDLDRKGVERWLSARLADVDGVAGTKAKIARRSVEVRAKTPQRDVAELQGRLEAAAQERLDELDLAAPLTAKAKVTSRRQS
jgi:hypothetical protein